MRAFDEAALAGIFADVDRLRRSPEQRDAVVALLAEQSPIYAGLTTNNAGRLRGYLLASFETMGLPASAVPFVIEELENGLNPYAVAAAAKAIRGARDLPEQIVALLLDAIERLRSSDDVVCFDYRSKPAIGDAPVTALTELFRTLGWLGARAKEADAPLRAMLAQRPPGFSVDVRMEIETALAAVSRDGTPTQAHCCAGHPAPIAFTPTAEVPPSDTNIRAMELQDQDGTVLSFGDFFLGRPSVLTFFYTRCMNPNKCSLTITKLARLQERIRDQGMQSRISVAAITYDPAFDLPNRLRAYGADRGMSFDERNRLLRTTGSFEPFQRWLDLGVGYGSTTVNQHRLDIVILDEAGQPRASVTRAQWDEGEVLRAVRAAMEVPAGSMPAAHN
jgi:cytochrome oxidase Cu insertion factor (SCO1/SenC/PrrC family)